MSSTLAELLKYRPIVTDGAWGTQLQKLGLGPGDCPDAWNLQHPELVERVASSYVQAGSQVILTNTFGANRFILERHGLADKVVEINRSGVEISLRAAGNRAKVFASIGPSGKLLLMGDVSPGQLLKAFEEQAQALATAGAHAIVIETMADLEEAKLALQAAKSTGLPVVVCMSFDSGKQFDRTMMGVTPEHAAETLTEAGADVIGTNCGQAIQSMVNVVRRLRAATDRPIWAKPNAGKPELQDGQAVYKQTPSEFAQCVPQLIEAGADFVGGCCGTSPEFIAEMATVVAQYRNRQTQ